METNTIEKIIENQDCLRCGTPIPCGQELFCPTCRLTNTSQWKNDSRNWMDLPINPYDACGKHVVLIVNAMIFSGDLLDVFTNGYTAWLRLKTGYYPDLWVRAKDISAMQVL